MSWLFRPTAQTGNVLCVYQSASGDVCIQCEHAWQLMPANVGGTICTGCGDAMSQVGESGQTICTNCGTHEDMATRGPQIDAEGPQGFYPAPTIGCDVCGHSMEMMPDGITLNCFGCGYTFEEGSKL